jgi:trigger factor
VKSSVTKINETRVKIEIEVTFEELAPSLANAYKTIGASITIPGFRKGHVPNAMIEKRVGRAAILDEAVNAALPNFYTEAAKENDVKVIGRPQVDIKELVDNEKLAFEVEVDVRPEITLPNFSQMTIEVDDVAVADSEIDEQIEALRTRFGTLTTVEKPAEKGLFVTIDLVASKNGEELDGGVAKDISYEVGSASMIEGLDEAIIGLSAGEAKRFSSPLVGMPEGETGDIDVTVKAVKNRDLPPLDDSFAAMASEFDTLAQLRQNVAERLERVKTLEQGSHARDLLVEKLFAEITIPLPQNIIDNEVNEHLEKEGRLEDSAHRAEVTEQTIQAIKQEILFDTIVDAEQVSVNENELTEYLVRASQRYGMTPDQFIKEISEAGQINSMVAEVARAKGLAGVLSRVTVKTKSGKVVDLEALAPKQAISTSEQPHA